MKSPLKLVILDRDGVINREQGHVTCLEQFEVLDGVYEAITSLHQAGIKICVASNQSGLARGILTQEALEQIQEDFEKKLALYGGHVTHWFYSPWHPNTTLEGGISQWLREHDDRKPRPGMLRKALKATNCKVEDAVMIGDSAKDRDAAQALGMRFIGIKSSKVKELMGEVVYDSLSRAVSQLFSNL